MGKANPLGLTKVTEVTTLKMRSKLRERKVMVEEAMREQGLRDQARVASSGKRHKREPLTLVHIEEYRHEMKVRRFLDRVKASRTR